MFSLDPKLQDDTVLLASLPLCELLLMNDANYPWLILVPRRVGLRELHDINDNEQQQFLRESNAVSAILQREFAAEKLNVAALGNQVAQLHIHHIARFHNDSAWPRPVWGAVPARAYTPDELVKIRASVQRGLYGSGLEFTVAS